MRIMRLALEESSPVHGDLQPVPLLGPGVLPRQSAGVEVLQILIQLHLSIHFQNQGPRFDVGEGVHVLDVIHFPPQAAERLQIPGIQLDFGQFQHESGCRLRVSFVRHQLSVDGTPETRALVVAAVLGHQNLAVFAQKSQHHVLLGDIFFVGQGCNLKWEQVRRIISYLSQRKALERRSSWLRNQWKNWQDAAEASSYQILCPVWNFFYGFSTRIIKIKMKLQS